MRKIVLFTGIICILLLAACSGNGEKASKKENSSILEATLGNASFILLSKDGELDPEGDRGTVKLEIDIKNITKESIDIYPELDIHLYDGDDQIDAIPMSDTALDLTYSASNSLGAGKKKTYTVLFDVEREGKYELNIEPFIISEVQTVKPVTIEVDMGQYSDSYSTLIEPAEALQAYIETIYFDKEHDNVEELMNINVEEQMKEAEKGFTRFLKDATYQDIEDKKAAEFHGNFKKTLKDKGEIEVKLKGNSGEKALVEVSYAAISYMSVGDEYSKVRQTYTEKSKVYDREAAEEYALSKLDTIISQTKVEEGRRPIEVYLVKKDGKWSFDNKYGDSAQKINDTFANGRIH